MTKLPQKRVIIPIYGEASAIHESLWGCRHMLNSMVARPKLVLRASLDDFKFYMTSRRGKTVVTMITLDLTEHIEISHALGRGEKPIYLCPDCRDRLLVYAPRHCRVTIPAYRDRILYARSASPAPDRPRSLNT